MIIKLQSLELRVLLYQFIFDMVYVVSADVESQLSKCDLFSHQSSLSLFKLKIGLQSNATKN